MGELSCSEVISPILVRLVLPVPISIAAILQQTALLLTRPSHYSAVGGKLPCSGVILTFVLRVVCVRPVTALPPYTAPRVHAARFCAVGRVTLCCAAPYTIRSTNTACFGRPFTVLSPPPYTTSRVHAARFCAVGCVTLGCASPYTVHRVHAAWFGAMSVSVLGDPSPCCPPTLHAARFCAVGCVTPCCVGPPHYC